MLQIFKKTIGSVFGWIAGIIFGLVVTAGVLFLIVAGFVAIFNGNDFAAACQTVWQTVAGK